MKFNLYRISEHSFFIYSLDTTNRSRSNIQLVACGLAWNSHGEYSKEFYKAAKKHNVDIDKKMRGTWITAETYSDFVCRLYHKTYMNRTLKDYGDISGPLFNYISNHYNNSTTHKRGLAYAKILKAFDSDMDRTKLKSLVLKELM